MRLITKMLKQWAVYWPLSSTEVDAYGQPTYGTAVEIRCRWQDRVEETLNEQGILKISKAKIYVASDVDVGGVLWQGRLVDVPTSLTEPKKNAKAFEIIRFDKLPDLKIKSFLRTAYL